MIGFGTRVVVANVEGTLYCAPARCPHGGTSFVRGILQDRSIVCSSHMYEFDLETGRCTGDLSLRLQRYQVRVDGDDVLIDMA